MPAPAMNTGDWISAALDVVQILAIVVGALWGVVEVLKGRLPRRRYARF